MVEYLLPKQKVAGSSPVSRSRFPTNIFGPEPYCPYCPELGVRTVRAQAIRALHAGKAQDVQSRAGPGIARNRRRVRQIGKRAGVERQLRKLDVDGFDPGLPLHGPGQN